MQNEVDIKDLLCILYPRSSVVLLVTGNSRNLLGEGADKKKKRYFVIFTLRCQSVPNSRSELLFVTLKIKKAYCR